ncbi:shikimate dehydrogenase [Rhodocaloribacter sp.]
MSIDARTRLVLLLGDPVAHSRSPLIHNAAFRHQGMNMVYVAARVAREDLAAAVAGLRALGVAGANVTIPHKQAVAPMMDTLSPEAEAVGAVNTIVCRREAGGVRLHGDNTDVAGFLAPLHTFAGRLRGAPMTVLGAGGAARAVVYALLTTFAPARLTVVARDPAKAARLAGAFAGHDAGRALRAVAWAGAGEAVRASRLLVNATPVGMHPDATRTPWPHPTDFGPGQIVYDLVYNPETTRLLHEAATRGATTLGGLDMLVGQAAAAYTQWTRRSFPYPVARAALRTDASAEDAV